MDLLQAAHDGAVFAVKRVRMRRRSARCRLRHGANCRKTLAFSFHVLLNIRFFRTQSTLGATRLSAIRAEHRTAEHAPPSVSRCIDNIHPGRHEPIDELTCKFVFLYEIERAFFERTVQFTR
ncbi:hypothetical protein [Burkholderia sp. BE17]|uniref:hypothetical protein n=1 Tax=Burkholderia sp. BE17 TaxID=2656644 RepID=UPI00128D9D72|nr:hypothetical protein [Burkholderia sp. BE17]MPV68168.1 hypothetical protein [Burkholderia sp. BE17]